jgi:hypothetical protein
MRASSLHCALLGALAAAFGAASPALAGDIPNELQLDINSFTCTVNNPPFGIDYTGSLTMSDDENAALAGVLIDGLNMSPTGTLMDFMGEIEFISGDVNGGFLEVHVLEADGVTVTSYTATIDNQEGQINFQAGQGFSIDGLTFEGAFSGPVFSGVDVLDWFEDQPLEGSFLKFQFNPSTPLLGELPSDPDTDIDIFILEEPGDEETDCIEREMNDVFDDRFQVDCACTYITGKLEKREVLNCTPDTYLFLFDKQGNVVAQDNDSSPLGNGKASAVFGVAPIANGDSDGATVRIGLTGRPDGIDNRFDGLFFNAPHEQVGEAAVFVRYFNAQGVMIGQDEYIADFQNRADAFRINYEVPFGTESLDVVVDNTVDRIEYAGDVDFYEIDCFPPACDVRIRIVGGMDYDCEPLPLVMGWYDKNGNLVDCFTETDDQGNVFMDVISDANGRVRFAISGEGDCDFDGLLDSAAPQPRNIDTPCVELPPYHGVSGVYVFCWEVLDHEGGPAPTPDDDAFLMLTSGDINMDGGVDVVDLSILINNWGWTMP